MAMIEPDASMVTAAAGVGVWDGIEPLGSSLNRDLSSIELDSDFGMMESPYLLQLTGASNDDRAATEILESERHLHATDNRPMGQDELEERDQEITSDASQSILEIPKLTGTLTYIWSRANELGTWRFCASELVSYIGLFARSVSTPFITLPTNSLSSRPIYFHPSLRAAYCVCAAYSTLTAASQPFFEQILDEEVDKIISSSRFDHPSNLSIDYWESASNGLGNSIDAFRNHLARVQTMILYYLLRAFGCSSRQRSLAEQLEPLLAAWTTELQLRLQLLDGQHCLTTDHDHQFQVLPSTIIQPEEWQSVCRTVLVSYLARSVYSLIKYKAHPLHAELASLPVPTSPLSEKAGMTYHEFADSWTTGGALGTDEDQRFINLLLVACKGLTITSSV